MGKTIRREEFDGFIDHPGSAIGICCNQQGEVLMVKLSRRCTGQESLELPGGVRERSESFESAFLRELAEETGYQASKASYLMRLGPFVGYSNEVVEVYSTSEISLGGSDPEHEAIWFSMSQLENAINEGLITDAVTIAALLWFARISQNENA